MKRRWPHRPTRSCRRTAPHSFPCLPSLAQSFAISDAWFCSVPSQTWPNRVLPRRYLERQRGQWRDHQPVSLECDDDLQRPAIHGRELESLQRQFHVFTDQDHVPQALESSAESPLSRFPRFPERLRGRHAAAVFVRRAQFRIGGSQTTSILRTMSPPASGSCSPSGRRSVNRPPGRARCS